MKDGLIKFDDIAVIDEKGDSEFAFPHLYVDFSAKNGPFFGFWEFLTRHEHQRQRLDGLKRVKLFPAIFDAPRIGIIHRDKPLKLGDRARRIVKAGNASLNTLYDVEGWFDFLAEADVIAIEGTQDRAGGSPDPTLIQITSKRTLAGKVFLDSLMEDPSLKHRVEEQIGREVTEEDQLRIVEFIPDT
jgi:hypothetical protein